MTIFTRPLISKILFLIFISFQLPAVADNSVRPISKSFFHSDEWQIMEKGGMIMKTKAMSGPWPEIKIFALLNTPPLAAMGIFAAYPFQKAYVPNMLRSEVVKEPKAGITYVDYEMDMPWPISNTVYQNKHLLEKMKDGLKVSWTQISSNATEKSEGHTAFMSLEGKTLMAYRTYVHPSSFLAKFLKDTAQEDVFESMKIIVSYIEKTYSKNRDLSNYYQQYVEKVLKGEKVFITK